MKYSGNMKIDQETINLIHVITNPNVSNDMMFKQPDKQIGLCRFKNGKRLALFIGAVEYVENGDNSAILYCKLFDEDGNAESEASVIDSIDEPIQFYTETDDYIISVIPA